MDDEYPISEPFEDAYGERDWYEPWLDLRNDILEGIDNGELSMEEWRDMVYEFWDEYDVDYDDRADFFDELYGEMN